MTPSFQPLIPDQAVSDVMFLADFAGTSPTDLLALCAARASQDLDCLPLRAYAHLLEPVGQVWADFDLADDEEELEDEEDLEDEEWDDEEWDDEEFADEDWEDDEDWDEDDEDWDEDDIADSEEE